MTFSSGQHWIRMTAASAASRWNSMLASFESVSPFQNFEHGVAAEAEGWDAQHWFHGTEAMALVLFKRMPLGVGMFWVVGGPSGDLSKCGRGLLEALCAANGVKHGYLRSRIDAERSEPLVQALYAGGLAHSTFALTSGMTVEFKLGGQGIENAVSKNWKRAIRKAENNSLTVRRWRDPDAEAIAEMLRSLERMKGVSVHFPKAKLESCIENLGDTFHVYRCDDPTGKMVAFRAAVVFGDRAIDLAAASNEVGRLTGASQLLVREMARTFAGQGIKYYELGGIDPVNNPGVTRFKIESGAREVAQLGEWDVATSEMLRRVANFAIAARQKMQQSGINKLLRLFKRENTPAPRKQEKTNVRNHTDHTEKSSSQDIRGTEGVRRKFAA